MIDHQKEYVNFINNLNDEDFNQLVVAFEKEYWHTNDVTLVNGPYDGGNDVVVRRSNGEQIMHTIQITVQQNNIKKKIMDDINKAKKNHEDKGYDGILDYFIKISFPNSKKDEIRHYAEIEFGITLNIYDTNYLASQVPNYSSLLDTLSELHKEIFPNTEFRLDQRAITLFDALSLSGDVTAIKLNFVQSLVLSFLYQNKEKSFKVSQIFDSLSASFDKGMNQGWFGGVIGKMKSSGLVIDIGDLSPKEYTLTDKALKALENIDLRGKLAEGKLIAGIKSVLQKFKIKADVKDILQKLSEIYDANYEIDETEFLSSTNNVKIKEAYLNLEAFISERIANTQQVGEITDTLLDICKDNESINEVSISRMFMKMLKSKHLERYLSNNPRDVFLDTQILLRIICILNITIENDNDEWDDIRNMLESQKTSKVRINFFTTPDYIKETAWHVIDAIKLERFLSLSFIRSLGKSKNVIFNLYLKLKEDNVQLSFHDYVYNMFGVHIPNKDHTDYSRLEERIENNLRDTFENLDVKVYNLPTFDNYIAYKRTYEDIYSDLARNGHISKSTNAIYNDLRTTLLLSKDYQCSEKSLFKEPFLITWDQSFYHFRTEMRRNYHELKNFFIYSPTKFANTISLWNFKIDIKAINYNIVSIVEDRFKYSNSNISFIDTLNKFFDKGDMSEWTLARKLAEIRQGLMDEQEQGMHQDTNLPIDIFLLNLYQYYSNPQNQRDYKDLVDLFMNNKFAEKILVVIKDNINKVFSEEVVRHFDDLIQNNKIVDVKIPDKEDDSKE